MNKHHAAHYLIAAALLGAILAVGFKMYRDENIVRDALGIGQVGIGFQHQ
jgi:hypothetical protein